MKRTPKNRKLTSKINFKLPAHLHDGLRKKAFEEYDSVCALIRRAIVKAYPDLRENDDE
jgi:hypothetical protein